MSDSKSTEQDWRTQEMVSQTKMDIARATVEQFGELPFDDKYLDVMADWLDASKKEAIFFAFEKAVHEIMSGEKTIPQIMLEKRSEFNVALRKYSEHTDPFRRRP